MTAKNDAFQILMIALLISVLLFLFLYMMLQVSFSTSLWMACLMFFASLLMLTIRSAYHSSTSYY